MSPSLFDQVLQRVVEQAMSEIAGVHARGNPHPARLEHGLWSWVRIVEPRPGVMVIGIDGELALALAGRSHDRERTSRDDTRDLQAELINRIASHLAEEMLGGFGTVLLGTPRTGQGVPDLTVGTWEERRFLVEGRSLAVFVQGDDLVQAPIRAAVNAQATARMPAAAPPFPPAAMHFVPVQAARAPTPDHMPLRIGHFRVIDYLGTGGMGVVYKAYHHTLGRLVALKVIRPELAGDQEFIVRFLREGRAAAAIDHPNVLPVLDAGFDDGHLYLAMHFAAGGDVASLLERHGPLPEARALLIMRDCLRGIQAIAAGGLVHRDIKPANILLDADGQPRLADLGLARSLIVPSGLSQPGVPLGTPVFMAPEQARAEKVDVRCDIYGVGSTLYCMLTGKVPFDGDSPYDIAAHVMYAPVPDPRTVRADLHQDTALLVMQAMAKDPAQRFQTPQEFRIAIERALANHEHPPPPPRNFWLRKLFGSGTPEPS
jgi:hypothetical protein